MMKQGILLVFACLLLASLSLVGFSGGTNLPSPFVEVEAVSVTDTIPLNDRYGDFISDPSSNPFDLDDPAAVQQEVEYDPETDRYIITERIGDDYFRMPTYLTFQEYLDYRSQQQEQSFFDELAGVGTSVSGLSGQDPLSKVDVGSSLVDRLFGGTEVTLQPQGSLDLTFGMRYQKVENPTLTERQQNQGGPQLLFDMAPQINVSGQIGEKLNFGMNYNSQATFNFDQQMKLEYATDAFSEDDIIKTIEAGNVSLPLQGSLIQGAQSLFGLKTQLQFGRLYVTALASQQKSERKEIVIEGGQQIQQFEVFADQYDENRHFFLSHFNRQVFEASLSNMPVILGQFEVKNIDVWVTNDRNVSPGPNEQGPRDVVAIADLGEGNVFNNASSTRVDLSAPTDINQEELYLTTNGTNDLFKKITENPFARKVDRAVSVLRSGAIGLQQSRDFEKVQARKLREGTDFTINRKLGFISLNTNLRPDQVLGVSYEYTYGDKTYRVGQMSEDQPTASANGEELHVLFIKMLKSTTPRVDVPMWDLMMKNIYNIGAYQVDQKDFRLDVYYEDPGRGQKRFLPEGNLKGIPLIQVLGLDQTNQFLDPGRDGVFDFISGTTINPQNGRVMFPVLEPFGGTLQEKIDDPRIARKYAYHELYDSTVIVAREYSELNRFALRGQYQSSSLSSEISLGAFNIPAGSVTVTGAGGVLKEGRDYDINYGTGRITILRDDILSSGQPIKISFEDSALFGLQTKTLIGLRADYKFSENFNIGATYMHLFERPFTQKVNIGNDPINNRIYGLDINFTQDAPWLTRMVDGIPFIETKAPSSISFFGEAAALKPGHSKVIDQGTGEDDGGLVYIDDFDGSVSPNLLGTPVVKWRLASIPQNDGQNKNPMFPEGVLVDDPRSNVNRARLNWYQLFSEGRAGDPNGNSNPYTRQISEQEIFPLRQLTPNNPQLRTFDLAYYPNERGPYNLEYPEGTAYSEGLTTSGELQAPETRWAGIMRDIPNTNFEQVNVEFIEFWMLSPFLNADGLEAPEEREGDMYLNIGNISEDILKDARRSYENGLPSPANGFQSAMDTTSIGAVPRRSASVTQNNGFPVEGRELQDVGFDGLSNEGERQVFQDYLNTVQNSSLSQTVKDAITNDPSNDDFAHYLSYPDNTTVFDRYSRFNNSQGNSLGDSRESATPQPDIEDLNNDNTLNETESYFQYKIPLRIAPGGNGRMEINEYITDERVTNDSLVWYRFKIPIADPKRVSVGGIQDFRSIRFLRLYLKDFEAPVVLRMARFNLVRNQWRRYLQPLDEPGVAIGGGDNSSRTQFDVNAINIEENSERTPFKYVLPTGIRREKSLGVFDQLQNEGAMTMQVRELDDGDSRAIYKTVNMDMRNYDDLRMFVHAEAIENGICPEMDTIGDLSVFIRLGSDFKNNYYEYEIPLTPSDTSRAECPVNNQIASTEYAEEVWKEINEFDFPLKILTELKKERNRSNTPLTDIYESCTGDCNGRDRSKRYIRIKGNPNLGFVKTIMIGVRNPKADITRRPGDLGRAQCGEVWINELRLNGLNEKGGYAAVASVDMQLADFANVTASGSYSSIGFGGLDKKLDERLQEEITTYDVALSMELGKFLPEKSGIKVPVYAAYSNKTSTPQYDPYDLDIVLDEKIAEAESKDERNLIKEQAQTVTEIRNLSLTNIRKERTGGGDKKPMPWDISNFSATYAYSSTDSRDPIIEQDQVENHTGQLNYSFSRRADFIRPLKKLPSNDWLKFLREFNFNPLPNTITIGTQLDRQFAQTRFRFTDPEDRFSTTYAKRFTWDRTYNVQWDLAKSLKLNFNANNYAVIDEPDEYLIRENPDIINIEEYRRDSIWEGIRDLGRTKNYQHNLTVDFTVPTKVFPFLDWVNIRAKYSANYGWNAAPRDPVLEALGNTIQNGQKRNLTADFNFETLYNKSKYLKKISRGNRPARRQSRVNSRPNRTKSDGKEEEKKKKEREPSKIERALIRPFLAIRKFNVRYTEDFSTFVPGFTQSTEYLGLSSGFDAPGWDFVAGLQPTIRELSEKDYGTSKDWLHQITNARNNSWITSDVALNDQVLQTYNEKIDVSLKLEPLPDFNIDLTASRNFRENHSQNFRQFKDTPGFWKHATPYNVGEYSMSYLSIKTLFQDTGEELRDRFQDYLGTRVDISQQLGGGQHSTDSLAAEGYTYGYGVFHRDVMIPAFIATYSGKNVADLDIQDDYVRNSLFKQIPLPNWNITYSGLNKLPFFKDIFQSVRVSHSYRSSLKVNSFETNLAYFEREDNNGLTSTDDFVSRLDIPTIVIEEAFSPLIGIDIRLKNDLSFKIDYNKGRSLAANFDTYLLTERLTEDITIGFGWRMQEVSIPFLQNMMKQGSSKKTRKKDKDKNANTGAPQNNRRGGGGASNVGDLGLIFDFSLRDNLSYLHYLDTRLSEPDRGTKEIRFAPSAEYQMHKQLALRLFFEYSKTIPYREPPYRTTNMRGGVVIRFTLNAN